MIAATHIMSTWPTDLALTKNHSEIKITIWNFTGNLYRILSQFDRALQNFQFSEMLLQKFPNADLLSMLYLNISICYSYKKDHKLSFKYAKKTLKILETLISQY